MTIRTMNLRTFLLGLIVGVAVTTAVFLMFGNRIRSQVAGVASETGRSMQKVGKAIERQGKGIR